MVESCHISLGGIRLMSERAELSDPTPSLSAPLLTWQLCLYFEKGQKTEVSQIYFLAHSFILSSAISCINI